MVRTQPHRGLTVGPGQTPVDTPQRRCALLIFDCDGVLVDSERISHQVLVAMLAESGITLGFDDAVARFIGASTARCAALVAELLGDTPDGAATKDFMHRFAERSRAAFSTGLQPVAGVPELLAALTLPYCVASNGNLAKMNSTLGHTGLLPLFAGRLYSADDVAQPKPAPDLFLHAAGCQGVAPADCVVVEDTPTGIAAARAAGMRAWGYAAMTPAAQLQAAGADAVFTRMAQLPVLLALLTGSRPLNSTLGAA